ncbi:MAG: SusC/RagA family TonB-linked outer membrane protein [Bacteroidales bacterium]|nr:SusC/RagA family TonB-linked outer membrane protein [Bacteroidales bacterium]MCI2145936.1 SusC/RagA family TonB-linked outer membrane protein [Bacteroidales bacterium]
MKKYLIILMLFVTCNLSAQVSIKGTVTSATDKEPIPGASVVIKGTTIGTTTDIDGRYSIKAPDAQSILVFSCIGYEDVLIPADGKELINVAMNEKMEKLDDVVVMGYSNKTKNEITSAVSVISSDKLVDVTSQNIESMLQGKVAGVSVVNSSGQPGSEPLVRIRGISSMNAPQGPLYVVDGIIGGSYDPNDIETLTVLKDAGSTGMYGAQANGGVIVITTKSAKSKKMTFNFKANVGFTRPDFDRQKRMNSAELYNYYREYFRDPETYMVDDVAFNNAIPKSVLNTDTDWRGLAFRTGTVQQYYFSLMGKSDRNSYYDSISYFDEDGTMRNTGYKQVNVRSNNTFNLTDWLKITSNIDIHGSTSSSMDSNLLYYLDEALPWDSPYDENGDLRKFSESTGIWMRDKVNPLLAFEDNQLVNNVKSIGLDYDFSVDVKITPWLSFNSQNRVSGSTDKTHYHRTTNVETMESGDFIQESQTFVVSGITTDMFKAKYNFGKHTVSGLFGYEAQREYGEEMSASGKGLPYGLYVLDVASNTYVVGGSNYTNGMQSLISQVNYDYGNKYFVTASFRVDQSSTFDKANRTAMFPSISGSWVVGNEPFMAGNDLIKGLKLRASWGKTGMKDIGASKYLEKFAYSTQYDDNTSAVPTQMSNPNLKWEQTTQFNVGTSFSLADRLDIDLNFYRNITNNLLVYRDLPPSGGFDKQWQNFGSVLNTGFETSLGAHILKDGKLKWNADFSISYNYNRLFGFGDTVIYTSHYGVMQVYKEGCSLYTWYVKDYAGIDPETGRRQFIDENGDKTFDYASARYVEAGSPLIPWEGGISTDISYGNWKLCATGNFVWGDVLYGRQRASDLAIFVENSLEPSSEDVIWKQPGDIATIGLPAYASSQIYDTGMLVRGDYFKVRNITLSYTFDKFLHSDNKLTLALSCDNLCTFTNVWGADPEVNMSIDSDLLPGEISTWENRYPNNKQYVFQVNLTF